MTIVIQLKKNENGDEDIAFEDGKIVMSENGEAAAVQLKERLLLDRNEAIDNPLIDTKKSPLSGTDWHGIIWDAAKSKGEKELEIKRVIFSTPGVKSITYWSWQLNNRTLNLNFKIETLWGELEIGEVIQL